MNPINHMKKFNNKMIAILMSMNPINHMKKFNNKMIIVLKISCFKKF